MYEIVWIDGRQENICNDKIEVNKVVNNIGSDGGLIKWITEHKAVISFYNQIIAYVDIVVPKLKKDFLSDLTEEAVRNLDAVEAKAVLLRYDEYVAEMIDNNRHKDIQSLLYFIAFIR